jgi:hypothetical protein
MAVRHIFLWSVKDGFDGDAVLSRLSELETGVPGLRGWSIGKHEGGTPNSSAGSWQYALTCDFDSFEDLDAYQSHPFHEGVVADVMDSCDAWAVIDYTLG